MSDKKNHLVTDKTKMLQIPYEEYARLAEEIEEGQRCLTIKKQVLADLAAVLGVQPSALQNEIDLPRYESVKPIKVETVVPQVEVPVLGSVADAPVPAPAPAQNKPAATPSSAGKAQTQPKESSVNVPPIKQDISMHFNRVDESGRLFNIFKQYYTFLNDACGGTVRVTLKDGICSMLNYDAWEEFAFIDIFDGRLRIGVNSSYTDQLKALDLCEVPRLLSSRYNLICVQVSDLNQTVLNTLVKAFNEAGAAIHKSGV